VSSSLGPVRAALRSARWGPTASSALLAVFLYAAPALAEEKPRERSREQVAFGIEVAQLGLWQEAMYRWSRAVELDPESATARNNLAVAYEQMGEFDRANQEYERALELEPNNVYIRQNYELFREAYERKKRTDRRSGPS
jgi:Flp pilus assembly protein TadD